MNLFKFLLSLLFLVAIPAASQTPDINRIQQNRNLWKNDNYEQGCTITATGSPGTFTPTCALNFITITAAGQTIALPPVGLPPGAQPNMISKSVELRISYSSANAPSFGSGYSWVNGFTPGACGGSVITGCLSAVVGLTDWVECRTIDATDVGCGAPLTAMSAVPLASLVAQQFCTGTSSAGCTTAAINATGANLFVILISSPNPSPGVSDTSTNTWVQAVTNGTQFSGPICTIYYVANPTTTATQTFSTAAAVTSEGILAFHITSPALDQSNGSNSGSTSVGTIQPGSITPSMPNEIIVALGAIGGTAGFTVNSSFVATLQNVNGAASTNYGTLSAYLFQGAAAAVNPTFTTTGGNSTACSTIASFQ